jgi:hypothetical protein
MRIGKREVGSGARADSLKAGFMQANPTRDVRKREGPMDEVRRGRRE